MPARGEGPGGLPGGVFGCGDPAAMIHSAPVIERICLMNATIIETEAKRQLALLKARCVDLLLEEELYRKLC